MKNFLGLLFVLSIRNWIDCARILGVFPIVAPSHYILGSALMKGLAERGHDVTIITPFQEKNPPKNGTYKEIFLSGFQEKAEERRKDVDFFGQENANSFLVLTYMNVLLVESTEITLAHPNVQKLIHSNEKFDIVIVEQFMNDALKAFASHFKAPLVLFSTIGANAWVNLLVGNPAPSSYIPALFLSVSTEMSFFERTVNSLMYVYTELLNHVYTFPRHSKLVEKYFPNNLHLEDVLYNASLVLLNSHPSTNQPVPTVPSMVDIGGIHVRPSRKLPMDLQNFLDSAKEGAIYFSFGSNLKSCNLPVEKRQSFLNTFAKLKQKVLWKWEEDVLPGQPSNVKLSKWFPQQDILAHPNVKLFITHGGLLSTTETIYHGVPVLAIPIFGDQKLNAQNIVNSGFGLALNYRDVTEENLTEKVHQLLNDSKYSENAKRRSKAFHDRLNSPMDVAGYWVEYVVRHGGAPHLKVAGVDVPLYQYFLLDVIVFVIGVIMTASYLLFKVVKICFKRRGQEKVKKN